MIGGDKEQANQGVGGTFSSYTDAELFAELGRLANQLGIKMTLTIATDEKGDRVLDTLLPARS